MGGDSQRSLVMSSFDALRIFASRTLGCRTSSIVTVWYGFGSALVLGFGLICCLVHQDWLSLYSGVPAGILWKRPHAWLGLDRPWVRLIISRSSICASPCLLSHRRSMFQSGGASILPALLWCAGLGSLQRSPWLFHEYLANLSLLWKRRAASWTP